MRLRKPFLSALLLLPLAMTLAHCERKGGGSGASSSAIPGLPAQPPVAGSLVLVGTLQKLPGEFPANDLYKYAYVMRYSIDTVLQGALPAGSREVLVAHYDPRTARSAIADDQKGKVGGGVVGFTAGDRHYLVLQPLDSAWTGAIEDENYQDKSPRWWAAWCDKI